MSVLIRGMKMPERCGVCPCFHANGQMYCQAVPAGIGKRIVAPYGLPRPDWCPLVEIPDMQTTVNQYGNNCVCIHNKGEINIDMD